MLNKDISKQNISIDSWIRNLIFNIFDLITDSFQDLKGSNEMWVELPFKFKSYVVLVWGHFQENMISLLVY